jgi:hypothetical protein
MTKRGGGGKNGGVSGMWGGKKISKRVYWMRKRRRKTKLRYQKDLRRRDHIPRSSIITTPGIATRTIYAKKVIFSTGYEKLARVCMSKMMMIFMWIGVREYEW